MTLRRPAIALTALVLGLAIPAVALAHPLGNFTINHYAGIRVLPAVIRLDVVTDMAEIPTFQERQRIDTNGDGSVGPGEIAAERAVACDRLAPSLSLTVGGARQGLAVTAAGLSFPPGAGDLATMRLVCEYEARPALLSAGVAVAFADTSYAQRIGWREIVVEGEDIATGTNGLPSTSVSDRLTHYPSDLLIQPLDIRSVEFSASPGGSAMRAWTAPDATPLGQLDGGASDPSAPSVATGTITGVGAVPGGIGAELSSLVGTADLTLPAIVASLLVAMGLGALHAASPGHGKTVMAAYLVGSRGTARHAVALGITVTIAHTLGVLALAAVTVLASSVVPPERLYPILGLTSGAIVVAIGLWLLLARYRGWSARRARGHTHSHGHDSGHGYQQGHERERERDSAEGLHIGEHSHGSFSHSHIPVAGTTLSWRSLFALGLSGGLVPSASALILLLGSIAAGRLEFGVVLVLAFGVGMAVVLGGVGLALVYASRLLERAPSGRAISRLGGAVPTATALVVLVAGVFLTSQALTQVF